MGNKGIEKKKNKTLLHIQIHSKIVVYDLNSNFIIMFTIYSNISIRCRMPYFAYIKQKQNTFIRYQKPIALRDRLSITASSV